MPMHDWTRVSAGTFHDFHNAWITHLKEALHGGLLPPAFYALGEPRTGDLAPDILARPTQDFPPTTDEPEAASRGTSGLVAVAEAPPRVRIWQEAADDVVFSAGPGSDRSSSAIPRGTGSSPWWRSSPPPTSTVGPRLRSLSTR